MAYCGYIVKVEHLRKHMNADRLQIATFFGNDTIVGLNTQIGDIGIYFPVDGQLSERYCAVNDLVRRKVVKSLMDYLCHLFLLLTFVKFLI